jgi:phosphopantothenoylcysteine decarboxylase/phosphopantothenate--cysteine ligase
MAMRIVITCGPSYEPLDRVRRLTNFSTGELGTLLAEGFADAGHGVLCFRGEVSTFGAPLWPVEVVPFTTNDDLASRLQRLMGRDEVQFVFHAAALCDFRVAEVRDEAGEPVAAEKISSREGALQVKLEPAPKLIAGLRRLFPASILIGWKYELDGTPESAIAAGRRQMDECLTDACVVNGTGYGEGFGMVTRSGERVHLPNKPALCRYLIEWAARVPVTAPGARPESFHALASFMPLGPFV